MRRSAVQSVLAILVFLLLGFAGGYFARPATEQWIGRLKQRAANAVHQRHLAATFVGRPAVDVASVKMDGTPYRLSDSRGKVVLLFFWASWCPYSRAALPGVQAIQNRYANRTDFQIVGVSLDSSGEMLRAAVQSHDIRWVNVFENGMSWNGPFAKAYEIRAIPSLWVIGKDSKVTGADVSLPAAEDILSVLLENRHREGTPQGASAPTSGPPWDGACSALPAS